MIKLKCSGKTISQEEYDKLEDKFAHQEELFRFFAVKSRFTKMLWMKRCVKHRMKNTNFQGVYQTNWDKIFNAGKKRR